MGLKDNYKKWSRKNYELTISELEKRRGNTKYLQILYFVFAVITLFVGCSLLSRVVDVFALPSNAFTNQIVFILVVGAITANIILLFSLHFINNMKYAALENEFVNLMIYLKKVNGR